MFVEIKSYAIEMWTLDVYKCLYKVNSINRIERAAIEFLLRLIERRSNVIFARNNGVKLNI